MADLGIKLLYGLSTALPAQKVNGRLLFCTDTGEIYFDINNDRVKLYEKQIADAKKSGTDAQTDVDALEALVGTPDTGKTIVQMIKALEAEITGGTTGEEGDKSLSERVADAEKAITKLNGDENTAGSVQKTVADAVAAIVAGADEDFDTLKEIADWITNDTTGAAQMANDIAALKQAIGYKTPEEGEEAPEIETVDDKIDNALADLKVEDEEVENEYVSAVSQTSGVITVTRKALPSLEGLNWGTFDQAAAESN